MKTYSVKEAYVTLQGEGAQTGRAAVFLRFAGCNLWTGLERDRPRAVCQFCDTDFVGTDGENGGNNGHSGFPGSGFPGLPLSLPSSPLDWYWPWCSP